jgi:hypothetical protein
MDPQKIVGWCQQDLDLATSGTMSRVTALATEVERQRRRAESAEQELADLRAKIESARLLDREPCREGARGRCTQHNAAWTGDEFTGCDHVVAAAIHLLSLEVTR